MSGEVYTKIPSQKNLQNYEGVYQNFDFASVHREFSWSVTDKVNIAYEALDRQVAEKGLGDRTALYFEAENREEKYSFAQMMAYSNKFANVLKKYGIAKSDRVGIFMPRSPELYMSFLGAVKRGAVVVPMFEAFMEEAVFDRLKDSRAKAIVTTPELRSRIPEARLPDLKYIFVVGGCGTLKKNDIQWHNEMAEASEQYDITWVGLEEPYLVLYASGAEGKPKGVIHAHRGMVGLYITAKWVHDLTQDDVYWCTADPGWITGIAYGFLAPWMHGVPVVIRGGRFDAEDWYRTLSKYKVTVWYSAPTAFRMLIKGGPELQKKYPLYLRHILSVGEPLTQDVLEWSLANLDQAIYDTWWMSETGMNLICNYRCLPVKLGAIGKPFPGVKATVIDDEGNELPPNHIGNLAVRAGWPAMFAGIWDNHEKYYEYFRHYPWFVTGDAAYRDKDGYFFFQGRVDGVINTAGERVGPNEVETKLVEHPAVSDAGVVGKPDSLRGEIVKAYITLSEGYNWTQELAEDIRNFIKKGLAAHAAPREIEPRRFIPKTREGRNDRRVLREWALGLDRE